ncbi:MAG: SDR family oxidoreductase [Ruminococcaceae bacterium]|nr:SDR family oxidoreductase [Oscillospiraceae bacterium]
MRALITGASSGIGRDMARLLSEMGYDLVLTARRGERLEALAKELPGKAEIFCFDLSDEAACYELYRAAGEIDVLINNAGFGVFGDFLETDLEQEIKMLHVNARAMHILMKLYVQDFVKRDHGYILNVASAAGFMPGGPLLDGYYATKAYILNLSRSVAKGLKKRKSKVVVSALCPGPVKTEFEAVAGVDFASVGMQSETVARYAIYKLFRGKRVIVPGIIFKLGRFVTRFLPDGALLSAAYIIQAPRRRAMEEGEAK